MRKIPMKAALAAVAALLAVTALAAGCAPAADDADRKVSATFEIAAEGWGEGSSAFIVHLEGCCSATEGIDRYQAVYPDGTGKTAEVVPGRYHITVIPGVNPDGTSYRTGHERTVVFDDETREEHAETKARREGTTVEEALAAMDEAEEKDKAETGNDTEWLGRVLEYDFGSALPHIGDEAALADDAVAAGDVPAEVAELARYNLWHDMLENMPEMPEQTH